MSVRNVDTLDAEVVSAGTGGTQLCHAAFHYGAWGWNADAYQ